MTADAELIDDELGTWKHTIENDRIVFARVIRDDAPSDPMVEDENNGTIHSFNRRHSNFIGDGKEAMIEDLLANHEAVKLSYFKHSACRWMVADAPTPAGVEFQWDGTRFAGLWVPNEQALENIGDLAGDERKAKLLEYAGHVVDEYTDYCNGNVYEFTVEAYPLKKSADGIAIVSLDYYRENVVGREDACSNNYGYEETLEEAELSARRLLDGAR